MFFSVLAGFFCIFFLLVRFHQVKFPALWSMLQMVSLPEAAFQDILFFYSLALIIAAHAMIRLCTVQFSWALALGWYLSIL